MNAPIWRGRTVPIEPAFVDEVALRAAATHAHRLAVVDARTGRGLTFGELHDRSRLFAAGLVKRGVGRGDVLGMVAASSPDYAVALYGALVRPMTRCSLRIPLMTRNSNDLTGVFRRLLRS